MQAMRKLYNFEVKQVEDRVLRFTGSTESEDRDGEVIKVSGWDLDNYKKNPVFMWAHDYSQPPIGKAVNIRKRQGNLIFDIQFAPKETYEFADTIYKLYQGGFLSATSVGFMPDPSGIIEGDGVKSPRRTYTKQELLELSAVPVPSNPDALRNAADKIGVSIKSLKNIFEDAEIIDNTDKPPPEVESEVIHKPEDRVIPAHHKITQDEIIDEFDYIHSLITAEGISDKAKDAVWKLVKEILRLTGNDIPDEIKSKFTVEIIKYIETEKPTEEKLLDAIKQIAQRR